MKRHATAVWTGDLKGGKGTVSTQSGVLSDQPYDFHGRFEDESGRAGTNPEELIAAAHAGCFAMQLSAFLAEAGHPADELKATAEVNLIPGEGIKSSHLTLEAKVPGISEAAFQEQAERAKAGCPVSGALSAIDLTLDARLVS